MFIKIIRTGSKANSYILQEGNESIIIDCGAMMNEILQALDFDTRNVKACIVSHSHQDHCRSIELVHSYAIPIFSSVSLKMIHQYVELFPMNGDGTITIGDWIIKAFTLNHDVENLGFLIYHKITKHKILYATDTFSIPYQFQGLTHVIIECNYNIDLLLKNIASGYISSTMKHRLLHSHMSMDNCIKFLKSIDLKSCRGILLIHLSSGNANAPYMQEEIYKNTGINTIAAENNMKINLNICDF